MSLVQTLQQELHVCTKEYSIKGCGAALMTWLALRDLSGHTRIEKLFGKK
jgi:hypothetical protein